MFLTFGRKRKNVFSFWFLFKMIATCFMTFNLSDASNNRIVHSVPVYRNQSSEHTIKKHFPHAIKSIICSSTIVNVTIFDQYFDRCQCIKPNKPNRKKNKIKLSNVSSLFLFRFRFIFLN